MERKTWKARWEGYCHRCGQCCYEKEYIAGGTLITKFDKPCRFLDERNKQCLVYVNRFRACKECRKVSLWTALFSPALPPDCGYVVKVRSFFRFRFGRNRWKSV